MKLKPLVVATTLTSFTLLGTSSFLYASDAHEHGIAELNVAFEAKQLEIMFLSPAANLVGFEHPPETEQQEKLIVDAVHALKQGYDIIRLPKEAVCLLKEADVEQSLLESHSSGHEEEHEHEKEHEHEEEHEHEKEHESGHSDFTVHYQFVCSKPEMLTGFTTGLFEQFPMIESIRYKMVSHEGQQGGELLPSKGDVHIKQ
ncbi:DUF2796 domain-containing protein [Neptunomonas japonica]|nr:DUF2796 domain-containing protein [Neptunomonas japonica]